MSSMEHGDARSEPRRSCWKNGAPDALAPSDAEDEHTLGNFCELLDTDRATLGEFATNGESLRRSHSWGRPPGAAVHDPVDPHGGPLALAPELLRGQIVRLERLPDDVPRAFDRPSGSNRTWSDITVRRLPGRRHASGFIVNPPRA
jgi:hypothetical protein